MSRPIVDHFTHGLTLAYHTYGRGPVSVVAFHGFGRTGTDFAFLEAFIGDRCTLHAFDLPFHGDSPSPIDRVDHPFSPEEWGAFFTAFADHIGAERIVLLGYSLGGRLALSLLEHIPGRIGKVFLVAPDGLQHRPWYRGLAGSALGRRIYAHFIEHPRTIHALIHGLHGLRLIGDRMHRFLIAQSDTWEKRQLMRDIWLAFRNIEPDLGRVATNINAQAIPVQLVFGERDKVIRPALGKALSTLAPDLVRTQLIPTGHVVLIPEFGAWLRTQELA
ncbi:MAG: alpha/beta hydrolase [Flavobacteriales bacterium]